MKNQKGFCIIETSLFLVCLGLLYLFLSPLAKRIEEKSQEATKGRIYTEIEIAKNRFDQESRPEMRDAFNNGSETQRFEMLSSYLQTPNSETYFQGSNINSCLINPLSTEVELR